MPMKPLFTCCYPGCQRLAERHGYCERHKDSGWQRDKTRQAMYDHRWERERKAFLAEHPWCHDCGGPATEVHHKKKHEGDPILFWDRSNWMPLCHRCHSKRTGRGE